MLGRIRRLIVDLVDFDESEVALSVLRGSHLAFYRIAGVQIEAANL